MKKDKQYSHYQDIKCELLTRKKMRRPDVNKDLHELDILYNNFVNSMNKKELLTELFGDLKKKGLRLCDTTSIEALNLSPESKRFCNKANELEEKYDLTVFLKHENEELNFILIDLAMDDHPMVFNISKSGDSLKHLGYMMHEDSNANMPIRLIQDSSKGNNLLRSLSEITNQTFPTVILYESSESDRAFFLSIPKDSSFTEVVKNFSPQITELHSLFMSTDKGRPKTKEFKQQIFNREFSALRKRQYSVDSACQKIAKDFNDALDGIKWMSLKRHYYPQWKKSRQKR